MSQKIPSDGGEKSFAVGRGLLAAAETLNFSMNEQRSENLYGASSRASSAMSSSLGSGEVKDRNLQMTRHGGGHINSTMKLFASLGLSPADLDMLAQVPEDSISVETLPHLIMQLKNRKADAGRRMGGNPRDRSPLSAVHSYRATRDDWGDMRAGRMSGTGGQASNRGQQVDYDYNSMQEGPSRGYERTDYGESSGGAGSRDRQFSNLSRERYGGLGMGASSVSDNVFMARRTGSPSQGKVQDFLGVMPQMFPHEWTQHVNGLRHAENRRVLLQMYPDWDPHQAPNRVSGSLLRETTNRSDGILGPVPLVPGLQRGGLNSNWGAGMSNQVHPISVTPKIRSRVVVAKYERKPLTLNSLLVLAQPFGTVCQHLVLKNKAFLELQTHEEAVAMVSFYQRKPAVMHGKEIILYLSRELVTIEKGNRTEPDTRDVKGRASQVVFFSNLPRERENKSELLTLARRFGTVEKYLFLNEQAFVQLGTPEDAEMMVKYYTLHPLTIKGRNIRLNICTKYKTLTLNTSWNAPGRQDMMRRGSASESRASFKGQKSASDRFKGKELRAQDYATHGDGSGDEVGEEAEEADTEKGSAEPEALMEAGAAEGAAEGAEEPSESESTAPRGQEEESAAPEPAELPPATGHACDTAPETGPEDAADKLPEEGEERQAESQRAQAISPCAEADVMADLPLPETADSLDLPDEELAGQQDIPMEQDFPENMDDFVTLDEVAEEDDGDRLDPQSKSGDLMSGSTNQRGGLRVVNVVGFKRGYNFLEEILTLAKPFGKVVRHLVLDVRPEAFLELSTEEGARAMVDFYSANVTPRVCGKAVKIYHSQTYATIQSGRVIYVGQIPFLKSSDASLLKIAEPFGKVRRYFLNQSRNECFIEMERGEDAERMANAYKENPPKFQGKRLTVYVSRKYKQLKHGHRPPPLEPDEEKPCKRERVEGEEDARGSASLKAMKEEEPPAKRVCVREENAVLEDPGSVEPQELQERQPQPEEESSISEAPSDQKEVEVKVEDSNLNMPSDSLSIQKDSEEECKGEGEVAPSNGVSDNSSEKEEPTSPRPATEQKPMATPVSLGLYQPNTPVGVEYVKMGYYCRVCFLFYSNEETAKKVHCSSLSHYQKLKKHLEKDKTPKAQ